MSGATRLLVGRRAPDFTLPATGGRLIRLSDFRGNKQVVLGFYCLDWTASGAKEITSLQARVADFEGVDAQVLGISVDSAPCHEAWAATLGGLSFPLLSDIHRRVCARYGLHWKLHNISKRAVVIVDKAGIVRYIEALDRGLPDPDRLLAVLRATSAVTGQKRRVPG